MTKACRSQAAAWLLILVACGLSRPARAQGEPAPPPAPASGAPASSAAPEAPAASATLPPASAIPSAAPPPVTGSAAAHDLPSASLANAGPFQPLLVDLQARAAVVRDLRARVERAPEVARTVLRPELFEASSDYRRALTEAVSTMSSAAFKDAPPAAKQYTERVVTERLVNESRVIREALASQYRESLSLIERVADAKQEERGALEQARNTVLAHLPVLLHEYRDNLRARTRLKQDVRVDESAFKRRLIDAAKFTSGLLKGVAEEYAQLRRSFGATPKPEEQKQLIALRTYRKHLAELQRKQIQLLDEYGTDTVELRQDLITTTGDVSEAIFDTDVVGGLFKKWKQDVESAITEHTVGVLLRAATVILIMLLFVIGARISRSLVRRALARTTLSLSHLAAEFIVSMSGRIIILIGVVVVLAQLGLEIAPLLAGLGIAGVVVGFALQDTLSNFASGMMILMYRPFDIGDTIEAGGTVGKVQAMSLVSTSVLTFDNQMLIVPNNKIWGDVIRNYTHQTTRRVDLVFGIGYRDDMERAERVLLEIVQEQHAVLADPAPAVRVHELGDSAVKFVVRPWVKTDDYWETYWAITREVKRRFDAEGISLPAQQHEVRLIDARRPPEPEPASEAELRIPPAERAG